MPRTRQVKKESRQTASLSAPYENDTKMFAMFKEIYEKKREELLKEKQMAIANYMLEAKQKKLEIPITFGNKKLKDLKQSSSWHTISSALTSVKYGSVLNSVLNSHTKKKSSDDGYLTSDSATDTAGRQSRSKYQRRSKSASTLGPVRRSSRAQSLSRNPTAVACSTVKKPSRKSRSVTRSTRDRFKTPANNKKLENFGMVTPKMKPNTPSVVLRRPCQGEIAISLRGSPLMTTSMVSETTANVNIPLADGRMINIQPLKGLRASEVPELDPEIHRQLQTLRDNLEKVCQVASRK